MDDETILTDNWCTTSKSPGVVIRYTIWVQLKSFPAIEGRESHTASHFIFVTWQIMICMTSIPIILAWNESICISEVFDNLTLQFFKTYKFTFLRVARQLSFEMNKLHFIVSNEITSFQ